MEKRTEPKQALPLKYIFKRSQLWVMLLGTVMIFVLLFTVTLWSFNTYLRRNVQVLGKTLTELVQPALEFQDMDYLNKTVESYLNSYSIRKIELFDIEHHILLSKNISRGQYSTIQSWIDSYFSSKPVYFDIYLEGENLKIGTLALYPSSEQMAIYIVQLLLILFISLLAMMLCWFYSVQRIYRVMMGAIVPLTHTAAYVRDEKAYNIRFKISKIAEFNILIQVFNQLLDEIQKWHIHLQQENAELSYQALHDELTGLPNRHVFYKTLQEIFKDDESRQNSVLMFIDNDKFKEINDNYGHLAGDAVLKEMALRLKARIRRDDVFVRIGGDEFAIILKNVNRIEFLQTIATNLIACTQEPLWFEQQYIHFGFSIGMAFSPYAQSVEQWIEQADRAMYQAKTSPLHWAIYHHDEVSYVNENS